MMPGVGVGLRRDAVIYFGSNHNCARPATIDAIRVGRSTPEWQTSVREGVRAGSARYQMLQQRMHERVVAAVHRTAKSRGVDLVVRANDIRDGRGLPIEDLTDAVVKTLTSAPDGDS